MKSLAEITLLPEGDASACGKPVEAGFKCGKRSGHAGRCFPRFMLALLLKQARDREAREGRG